jgi:PAS domain S-box-containing protein
MKNALANLIRTPPFKNLIAFAEHAHEGIAFIDPNGTVCFANSAWARMHGYILSSELIKKNLCIFHTPKEVRTGILPLIEQVKQKGGLQATLEHIRADGSAFQGLTKIIALNNGEGHNLGFVIFAADLTENLLHQQSLEALRLANEHLQKQVMQMCEKKRSLAEQIDDIKNKSDLLQSEISERPYNEPQNEAIPIREIPPFDPKKLKALADLAKRLSNKSVSI